MALAAEIDWVSGRMAAREGSAAERWRVEVGGLEFGCSLEEVKTPWEFEVAGGGELSGIGRGKGGAVVHKMVASCLSVEIEVEKLM